MSNSVFCYLKKKKKKERLFIKSQFLKGANLDLIRFSPGVRGCGERGGHDF